VIVPAFNEANDKRQGLIFVVIVECFTQCDDTSSNLRPCVSTITFRINRLQKRGSV
jgi:hypothetical protein